MNIKEYCPSCNGYGLEPRCPICNQAKQSAFMRDLNKYEYKPRPLTERNCDPAKICPHCQGQAGGEVDICEGPHVVGRRWVDCPMCGGTGVET